MRKGQSSTFTLIVAAAIAVIVLIILLVIFKGKIGTAGTAIDTATKGITCKEAGGECTPEACKLGISEIYDVFSDCQNKHCCKTATK